MMNFLAYLDGKLKTVRGTSEEEARRHLTDYVGHDRDLIIMRDSDRYLPIPGHPLLVSSRYRVYSCEFQVCSYGIFQVILETDGKGEEVFTSWPLHLVNPENTLSELDKVLIDHNSWDLPCKTVEDSIPKLIETSQDSFDQILAIRGIDSKCSEVLRSSTVIRKVDSISHIFKDTRLTRLGMDEAFLDSETLPWYPLAENEDSFGRFMLLDNNKLVFCYNETPTYLHYIDPKGKSLVGSRSKVRLRTRPLYGGRSVKGDKNLARFKCLQYLSMYEKALGRSLQNSLDKIKEEEEINKFSGLSESSSFGRSKQTDTLNKETTEQSDSDTSGMEDKNEVPKEDDSNIFLKRVAYLANQVIVGEVTPEDSIDEYIELIEEIFDYQLR